MFTGIIEELGSVTSSEAAPGGVRFSVEARTVMPGTVDGDSIAVNGVCLTALAVHSNGFSADVSQETLDRTTLGSLAVGARVNLERAVTPATRLGGHIVQGHVDGRGRLISAEPQGDFRVVRFTFPPELARYFVHKGSVAIEGISLTIAKLNEADLEVAVIPKTWEMTNLSTLRPGDELNFEVDVIAKYVERMLSAGHTDRQLTMETLKEKGFA